MALKACWPVAPGAAQAACNSFTLAQALAAALDSGSQVLNLSLTGPRDALLERLLAVLLARGVSVVGALPEGGSAGDSFPTSVAGVIAVRSAGPAAATPTATADSIAAPGHEVMTTVPGGGYEFQSGSSLAAASVSGVVALLREHRRLAPAELHRLLDAASKPALNACLAVANLIVGRDCPPAR